MSAHILQKANLLNGMPKIKVNIIKRIKTILTDKNN